MEQVPFDQGFSLNVLTGNQQKADEKIRSEREKILDLLLEGQHLQKDKEKILRKLVHKEAIESTCSKGGNSYESTDTSTLRSRSVCQDQIAFPARKRAKVEENVSLATKCAAEDSPREVAKFQHVYLDIIIFLCVFFCVFWDSIIPGILAR